VLSGEAPLTPAATISFREGSRDESLAWTHDSPPSDALAGVSVFDSHCAPIYLRDKTDVAFRPFGLDVFDKLSTLCDEVRTRLEQEQRQLSAAAPTLPMIAVGTQARALIDGLTALTRVEDVRGLATLSNDDEHQLNELLARLRDLQASDPKRRAQELRLKADRLNGVVRHLEDLAVILGDQSVRDLKSAADSVRIAQEALALLRLTAFNDNVLPGTGEEAWAGMWQAAGVFAEVAYPNVAAPLTAPGARCPLCQQTIGSDTSERLRHFAEYATSNAQTQVRLVEASFRSLLDKVASVDTARADAKLALEELAIDQPQSAQHVLSFLADASRIQEQIRDANGATALPDRGIGAGPAAELAAEAKALLERAAGLQVQEPALGLEDVATLKELEARLGLKEHLQIIIDEIERKKRLAAYRQCLDDTSTYAITRKSTELTKELVTDRLRDTFREELQKLDFKHLQVEVQAAGGAKGALFHRLAFINAPGVAVTDVLSEGESRALSLAAFLTELSTAPSTSAIIFDDPVSSLDHIWRERIARRLVMEATERQVIVFTHDLLFLRLLIDEAGRATVQCDHQYIRRDAQPGLCSPDLPWIAMRVKERIARLRDRWQTADKVHRTASPEEYERLAREIYALLREAWEQAIVEILLNDVVERFRPSIQTQRVKSLHDISSDDCKTIDDAMTECSRWILGHDQAAADGTPIPGAAELKEMINGLDRWVKQVRNRRD
jgi:hypothetical protein